MKLVITALAIILFGGCTTYVARDGSYSAENEFAARECRVEAAQVPGATRADAFKRNDAMAPAATKWVAEIGKCMERKGFKPA